MTLKDELPEIEAAARIVGSFSNENLIQYEDKKFFESNAYIADSTLFDVLTYEFKEGNPKKALADANTVVISEATCEQTLWQRVRAKQKHFDQPGRRPVNFKITGVYKENNSFLES